MLGLVAAAPAQMIPSDEDIQFVCQTEFAAVAEYAYTAVLYNGATLEQLRAEWDANMAQYNLQPAYHEAGYDLLALAYDAAIEGRVDENRVMEVYEDYMAQCVIWTRSDLGLDVQT
jgi:hypothetical protein